MEKYVLIVSGGEGRRYPSAQPKQFLEINGLPLLMHTFNAFSFVKAEIVLVLHENMVEDWQMLCKTHNFTTPHQIQTGGPKRFHSVKSGLNLIPDGVLLAIHDGVRPLPSRETIRLSFENAKIKGNSIPAIPVTESIRETDGSCSSPVDRNNLRTIQTPQVFHSRLIKNAYKQPFSESFTDDATVFESDGHQIHLSQGNRENIKITYPEDMELARHYLSLENI